MIIRISPSIENFREKILRRTGYRQWSWRDVGSKEPAYFFGMYRPKDIAICAAHAGPRTIIWCGSDCFQLGQLFSIVRTLTAHHICENEVEATLLRLQLKGRHSMEIRPLFFGNPDEYQPCFTPSKDIHVFLCAHGDNGRREQAGLHLLSKLDAALSADERNIGSVTFHIYGCAGPSTKRIVYHGNVPEEQFDREIRSYHSGLRLHMFDGFSEVIAKSILLGQYPISSIRYPDINSFSTFEELTEFFLKLQVTPKPNIENSVKWRIRLEKLV